MQFLSMKLATVNPRIDFNIDDLFTKEVRQNVYICVCSFHCNYQVTFFRLAKKKLHFFRKSDENAK